MIVILAWLYVIGVMITFLKIEDGTIIIIQKNGEEVNNFKIHVIFSLIFPITLLLLLLGGNE